MSVTDDFDDSACSFSFPSSPLSDEGFFESKETIIYDAIHGNIKVPYLCRLIIDTPQFERLRWIRQLGSTHYVYPSAKHTRWEHSLGVMKLAGDMVDHLMKVQPGICDTKDKLCVMVAGLCHDLGHGPFSHLFEKYVAIVRKKWSHEESSLAMLDYLIEDNDLWPKFVQCGLDEQDLAFIKEMIHVRVEEKLTGRGPEKHFLYEIVANKTSSIDVDKFDYLQRDNKAVGNGITFNYQRLIDHCLVLPDDEGKMRISYRDKVQSDIVEMFHDRARLHRKSYQHKTVKIIDQMIVDGLVAADQSFRVPTPSGGAVRLCDAIEDMEVFVTLTDDLFLRILNSTSEDMKQAREIYKRITKRRLYKILGSFEYKEDIVSLEDAKKVLSECGSGYDVEIIRRNIGTGFGDKCPLQCQLFHDKLKRKLPYLEHSMTDNISSVKDILVIKNCSDAGAEAIFSKWVEKLGIKVNIC